MTQPKIETHTKINKDTKIEFGIGLFFTTIGSIIGIFFLFYKLVIATQISDIKSDVTTFETEYKKEIKEFTKLQTENMIMFNSEVNKLNSNITLLNGRFNDLNNSRNNNQNNSGGFSMNSHFILDTLSFDELIVEK